MNAGELISLGSLVLNVVIVAIMCHDHREKYLKAQGRHTQRKLRKGRRK